MKFILSFFLLVFTTANYSYSQNLDIVIRTDDQPSVHGESYWNLISVKNDGKAALQKRVSGITDTIKLSTGGAYIITLHSVFGQKASKKIVVHGDTTIKFALEKRNKKTRPRTLSSRIKEGDTLYILHNASGVAVKEKLCITKHKGKFYGLTLSTDNNILQPKTELDKKKILALKMFEKQAAANNKPGGCSVIEAYTIFLNGKYYTVNDGTCLWSGYANLIKQIFQN